MSKHTLAASPRILTGRKVKNLRKDGFVPANVYGKDVKSLSVQVNAKDFIKLEKEVGETGLVYLNVDGSERPVLITNVQLHPVSGLPLHADLHQVNLKVAISAPVPIELIGEPIAVSEGKGILIQPLSEVEVEALPTDLPEKLELDVAGLSEVDQSLQVKDIKTPANVKILTDSEEMVAKIAPLAAEEVQAAPAPAEGETAEPVAGEPPVSAEATSESEAPKE